MSEKGVKTQHPDYTKMLPLWQKCIDAVAGENAIHQAGSTYLSKLKAEKDDEYKARKARTPFFNATWRTISGLKGMLFLKNPVIDVPAGAKVYLEDIDMAGTPIDVFMQQIVEEDLTTGRNGVLIDHPFTATDEAITVAKAAGMGLRPMMQFYPAKSIINWKAARINNVVQLTLVVLKESTSIEGDDEFAQDREDRYRVLDLVNGNYRQRVFRISAKGEDEQVGDDMFPQMNSKPLNYIPFVFFGIDSANEEPDSPPLLDLVEMNLHHYGVSADFEHGCHWSGLPTLFLFGIEPDNDNPIYIGGSSANCVSNPDGHVEYAQVQGGFEALQHNLSEKKSEMAVLGARMLEGQKTAVESAETQQQRSQGEQSQLAAMADLVSMSMTRALTIFCEWSGAPGKCDYQLNKDFLPKGMTPEELTALVSGWQAGAISGQTLFDNLQQGAVIASEVTYEQEQGRIESQTPLLVAPLDAQAP